MSVQCQAIVTPFCNGLIIKHAQDEYETIALLSTTLELDPLQIINWFVQRWQVEVTFEEVRAHLGVETQRQWCDKAIERTTPILFRAVFLDHPDSSFAC